MKRTYLRKTRILIFSLLFTLVTAITGCGKPEKNESSGTEEAVIWEDDSDKIDEFKRMFVSGYKDKPIGNTIESQFSVIKWQYRKGDEEEYLLCSYVHDNTDYTLIFYRDSYENVNIAEYYVEDEKQDKLAITKVTEEIFGDKVFSLERSGFFSNGKWAMEITNIDVTNMRIEYYSYWWNFEKEQMEQSEVDIKILNILDCDTMGDINHSIKWDGDDSFTMNKYDCEILLNNDTIGRREGKSDAFWESGMGEFKRIEKPENIPIFEMEVERETHSDDVEMDIEENQEPVFAYVPPEGRYWDGETSPLYAKYYIDISNTQNNSFDFEIYQAQSFGPNNEGIDYQLVFQHHTAVFTDASHAIFKGNQYTLYFECGTNTGYITISGFGEVIPDGSELYNSAWLQVS